MPEISALQLKITELSEKLIAVCKQKHLTVGTAESCTGGGIAAALTEISGASAVFYGGIVSYDNSVKEHLLGVSPNTLMTVGAVSEETACQMAKGAASALRTSLAVSVTGIAGPTGGTAEKPVGLVYIAACGASGEPTCEKHLFSGDRKCIRLQTAEAALRLLLTLAERN